MNHDTYGMVDEDYSRDSLLPKFAIDTLKDRYFVNGETSPQEAFARAAEAFADDIPHAKRLYDYASKLWFMFSTPILSNGGTKRGMPISCFLQYVPDSRQGLMDHYTESAWLASAGGGLGGYWGAVRSDGTNTSKGSKSNGSIPFMKVMDSLMLAFNQGATRRGAYAAYTDISHPEVEEFIRIRKPAGDSNRKCLNLHNAINVTDAFMEAVMNDEQWKLVDPHSKETKKVVSARELWKAILETRVATGEPYICFIDTANDALPESQKALGLRIHHTNLCLTGDTIVSVMSEVAEILEDIPLRLVGEYKEKYPDLQIFSYDVKKGTGEFKPVTDFALTKKKAKLIRITDENTGNSIRCTPDHKIFTKNRGYVMAKDLKEDDELLIE